VLEKDTLRASVFNRIFAKASLILVALFLFVYVVMGQKEQPPAKGPEYKIPPEAAAKENPVKPTEESLAKGKKLYGYDCAMCHGKNGDGTGDMASDTKNIPDFTKPETLKKRTDGELFYVIRNGKGTDMPPEGDRAKDADIWNMVNYVRSLAKS
jgi:mono/diheme cytochrome c family protein